MKLYGATVSWNVTRCVVALEEAGAEYQIVPIDFATAEHKSPEHLARNVRTPPAGDRPVSLPVAVFGSLLLRDLIRSDSYNSSLSIVLRTYT
jgi:hypothetical protein